MSPNSMTLEKIKDEFVWAITRADWFSSKGKSDKYFIKKMVNRYLYSIGAKADIEYRELNTVDDWGCAVEVFFVQRLGCVDFMAACSNKGGSKTEYENMITQVAGVTNQSLLNSAEKAIMRTNAHRYDSRGEQVPRIATTLARTASLIVTCAGMELVEGKFGVYGSLAALLAAGLLPVVDLENSLKFVIYVP